MLDIVTTTIALYMYISTYICMCLYIYTCIYTYIVCMHNESSNVTITSFSTMLLWIAMWASLVDLQGSCWPVVMRLYGHVVFACGIAVENGHVGFACRFSSCMLTCGDAPLWPCGLRLSICSSACWPVAMSLSISRPDQCLSGKPGPGPWARLTRRVRKPMCK